jgi:polysaccharide biosynthesis protein PslH
MRVLYLCHRIPYPPNKGDKLRAFHQLKAISARHEVDLFTLADDVADLDYRSALSRYCHRVTVVRLNRSLARLRALPCLLTRQPATLPYFYSAELAAEVRQTLLERSYDRIFLYCSAMAQYVEGVDRVPIIIDLVDVDSDKWRQYASVARFPLSLVYRREAKRLQEYEKGVCERSSCVLVSTEREARLLRQIYNAQNLHVVHNGVDAEYFKASVSPLDDAPPTVTFVGDMSYFPNQEAVIYFARQVLPIIHQSVPNVRFLIVGRNPGRKVRRLQKIAGVEVTGSVPDVRTFLAKAQVSVAPFSIAAGIQNKILEAMASGLPVVATSRTLQGLCADVAAVVEKGDCTQELAAKTVRLLRDPQLGRNIGMEGRHRVTTDYNWERSLEQLCKLLEGAITLRTAPEPLFMPQRSALRPTR